MYIAFALFCTNMVATQAAEPKFDKVKAKALSKNWLDPIMEVALWAIPVAGLVRIMIAGLMWLQKDEQERDQNPFHRTAITYTKWIIIFELLPVIYAIFGLANSLT